MSIRDSRVSFFTSQPGTATAISTATTTNGTTIDLKSGYTGSYFEGAQYLYGLRVHVLFTSITSTNNNVVLKWQVSDDNSTWYDDQQILVGELSALKTSAGTKVEVGSTLRTNRRYVRLCLVTTGMSGSSFSFNTWVDEGAPSYGYGGSTLRI